MLCGYGLVTAIILLTVIVLDTVIALTQVSVRTYCFLILLFADKVIARMAVTLTWLLLCTIMLDGNALEYDYLLANIYIYIYIYIYIKKHCKSLICGSWVLGGCLRRGIPIEFPGGGVREFHRDFPSQAPAKDP